MNYKGLGIVVSARLDVLNVTRMARDRDRRVVEIREQQILRGGDHYSSKRSKRGNLVR